METRLLARIKELTTPLKAGSLQEFGELPKHEDVRFIYKVHIQLPMGSKAIIEVWMEEGVEGVSIIVPLQDDLDQDQILSLIMSLPLYTNLLKTLPFSKSANDRFIFFNWIISSD